MESQPKLNGSARIDHQEAVSLDATTQCSLQESNADLGDSSPSVCKKLSLGWDGLGEAGTWFIIDPCAMDG